MAKAGTEGTLLKILQAIEANWRAGIAPPWELLYFTG